jgi:hypothetical protein
MTRWRRVGGLVLVAAALVPIVGALDLLAERRLLTAVLGLVAGALLLASGARLLAAARGERRG